MPRQATPKSHGWPLKGWFRRTYWVDDNFLSEHQKFWEKTGHQNADVYRDLSQRVINRPYLDIPRIARSAFDIKSNNGWVYHRNHDVSHAVRQRFYVRSFLKLIKDHGNDKSKDLVQSLSSQENAALELAVFLCRSGRTNELPGIKDPSNAARSASIFEIMAGDLNFEKNIVEFFSFCVEHHKPKFTDDFLLSTLGHDLVISTPEQIQELRDKAVLFKNLIDSAHHLDLVRCKPGKSDKEVKEPLKEELSPFFGGDFDMNFAVDAMMHTAAKACSETGTRVKHSGFQHYSSHNRGDLKRQCVDNPVEQMQMLEEKYSLSINEGVVVPGNVQNTIHQLQARVRQRLKSRNNPRKGLLGRVMRASDPREWVARVLYPTQTKMARHLRKSKATNNFMHELDLISHGIDPKKGSSISAEAREEDYHELLRDAIGRMQSTNVRYNQRVVSLQEDLQDVVLENLKSDYLERISETDPEYKTIQDKMEGNLRQHERPIASFEKSRWKYARSTVHWVRDAIKYSFRGRQTAGGNGESLKMKALYRVKGKHGEQQNINPDKTAAVCDLLHGCSTTVGQNIIRTGFNEDYCGYDPVSGYGPLGKGVYMTQEVAKASMFSTCSGCGMPRCLCGPKDNNAGGTKTVLICDAHVDNYQTVHHKSPALRHDNKEGQDAPDLILAESRESNAKSDFRASEVAVSHGSDLNIRYMARFFTNPSDKPAAVQAKVTVAQSARARCGH